MLCEREAEKSATRLAVAKGVEIKTFSRSIESQ